MTLEEKIIIIKYRIQKDLKQPNIERKWMVQQDLWAQEEIINELLEFIEKNIIPL